MKISEAKELLNNSFFVEAYIAYRKNPMGTDKATYERASSWMEAAVTVFRADMNKTRETNDDY